MWRANFTKNDILKMLIETNGGSSWADPPGSVGKTIGTRSRIRGGDSGVKEVMSRRSRTGREGDRRMGILMKERGPVW